MSFAKCQVCPANSVGEDPGLTVCLCAVGYFRASGEEDLPCTREYIDTIFWAPISLQLSSGPPSMPRNVEFVGQAATVINYNLSWDAPLDLGGRDDVSYEVCYQENGVETEQESCVSVVQTIAIISG